MTARRAGPAPIVNVRRVCRSDAPSLERFYADLSDESRAMRFLGATPRLSPVRARTFCTPDHEHREGFIAVIVGDDGRDRVVGHVCVEPLDDTSAEVAVAVADELQGQGLGRRLLQAAIAWGRRAGLRRLVGTAFASNARIIRLVRGLGLPVRLGWSDCATCEMSIDIAAPLRAAA
jgi:RimJ/RimL family protein N-acetyltransferase